MADNPPPDSTLWEAWDAQAAAARLGPPHAPPGPLQAIAADIPPPGRIPPRQWLYGTALIRRFVTVLVAPGGVGKSALALAQCVALASGRGFLGQTVHHSVPAWMLNLEDPMDELHRRLAALMLLHDIPAEALQGRLFLHSGRARRVCIARRDRDGNTIIYPDRDAIITAAKAAGIGCIMVDPIVKSHGLEENSNTEMDAAATAWAEVAEATGAAVQLIHHVRKPAAGTNPVADADMSRGAKALTDAARAALVLSPMTAQEAEQLGVPELERWRHVRLDDAKANMAPRSSRAIWFRLDSVNLGNGTPDYPHGDNVGAISAWQSTSVWQRLTPPLCNSCLDAIAAGPEDGSLFAPQRRGRSTERWAGRVLMDVGLLNEAQAAEVIAAWLKSGLLVEAEFRDPQQRKTRLGVRVTDAKRPTANPQNFHQGYER